MLHNNLLISHLTLNLIDYILKYIVIYNLNKYFKLTFLLIN